MDEKYQQQNYGAMNIVVKGDIELVERVLLAVNEIKTVTHLGERDGAQAYHVVGKSQDVREAIFYTLSKENLPLLGAQNAQSNLEEVFLSLVKGIEEGTNQ